MAGEKRKRAYGVSCVSCREKKISCDGVRPRCGGCKDTEEECRVPPPVRPLRRFQAASTNGSAAPSSQAAGAPLSILQMNERMARMERRMEQLEDMLGVDANDLPWSPLSASPTAAAAGGSAAAATKRTAQSGSDGGHAGSGGSPATTSPAAYEGAKYQLTVDGEGNVVYHGLTSWSRGPNVVPDTPVPPPPPPPPPSASTSQPPAGSFDAYNPDDDAALAPMFQAIATSKHISVAPALGNALLDAYFCYQVFNILERSTFLRHMALGGPMFSEFLLMSMYASATRMIDGLDAAQRKTQGELFERLAKEYLAKELEGPSKIATIQGLLLLSGRACSLGNISQGWNQAGLAFRMIQDLGIHLAPEKVVGAANLSREEQATRDRLFWAAFIWDKSISLALGREPTFPPRVGRDPSTMVDFDDDEAPWTAYFVDPLNCPPTLVNYVYQPKRRVAAFRYLGQLCLILHDVIMELYSTESRLNARQRTHFIGKTCRRIEDVWTTVPDTMKFNPARPSPPPWIFILQMLYHATSILVYRLVVEPAEIATAEGHAGTCLQHSITANQMAVRFIETFGERMTYVGMYSSFVAASFDIVLLEAKRADIQLGALERLDAWLDIMEKCVKKGPSIRRSIDHISSSVWSVVAKNPILALSEPGQRIMALHFQHAPPVLTSVADTAMLTNELEVGLGAFDFFDLFAPMPEPLGL
ncbi:Transcription factor [Niveomyces insectorum RCEF 264]|uniref:Transcription factor n=1 Tax=Niveomyces insectorum RCEF 264 TaxID=1081102 RepID=A0A167QV16_9HYPO|nr:Transcription factor [Niveomyces insectorum RCEF 264]